MSESKPLATAFEMLPGFSIQGVDEAARAAQAVAVTLGANLGPLSDFTGTFAGQGIQYNISSGQHEDADAGHDQHHRST